MHMHAQSQNVVQASGAEDVQLAAETLSTKPQQWQQPERFKQAGSTNRSLNDGCGLGRGGLQGSIDAASCLMLGFYEELLPRWQLTLL